jgi:hypothetical protein
MEACLESKEPTSEEIESEAEHEEVPKEEAAAETFGALKKWHGDQHLAVKVLWSGEEMDPRQWWAPEEAGSHLQRDEPPCYPCMAQGTSQDNVARGAPKGQTFRKRHQAKPEGITGIRNQGSRQEPCLGSRATFSRIFRKTDLDVAKQNGRDFRQTAENE